MIEELKSVINKSVNLNYKKNIFLRKDTVLPLGSILYIYIENNMDKLSNMPLSEEDINNVSEFTKDNILKIIMKTNQYVLITDDLENRILNLTSDLYKRILISKDIEIIKKYLSNYQNNIIEILEDIDELRSMNTGNDYIEVVPCSEYDPEYQISILKLDLQKLKEPILDIGCGSRGELVKSLRSLGLNAYGIDRKIESEEEYLEELSWFDKNFKESNWGTIISHLSFTNHFKREHLKIGDGHIKYAKKYMEILNSLKVDGSFYYVPDLEFIEQFISREKFKIEKYNLNRKAGKINSVIITKIK